MQVRVVHALCQLLVRSAGRPAVVVTIASSVGALGGVGDADGEGGGSAGDGEGAAGDVTGGGVAGGVDGEGVGNVLGPDVAVVVRVL